MKTPMILSLTLLLFGCTGMPSSHGRPPADELVSAWRSKIQFTSGAFASVKDLEFLYVFNAGGTMTESSNYDGAPPVPPAYGVWEKVGSRQFKAKYVFYATKPPANFDEVSRGGGWLPAGHGVLIENITVSEDGKSFRSTIHFEAFGPDGRGVEGGGDATSQGTRLGF